MSPALIQVICTSHNGQQLPNVTDVCIISTLTHFTGKQINFLILESLKNSRRMELGNLK